MADKQKTNETSRLITTVLVMAVLLFAWPRIMRGVEHLTGWHLLPPENAPVASTQPATTEPAATTVPSMTATPMTVGTTAITLPSTQPAGAAGTVAVTTPTTLPAAVSLGSAQWTDSIYSLQLNVTPVGGALESVVLNEYKQQVNSPDPFKFDVPYGDGVSPLATKSITVNGTTQDISRSVWNVVQKGPDFVVLGLDLTDGKHPLLSLYKRFTVRSKDDGGATGPLGYDTQVSTKFVNHTDSPMTVSMTLVGPTFPASESLRGGDRSIIAGYQGKNTIVLGHDPVENLSSSTVSKTYTTLEGQPMLWFGAGGTYFNAIVRPVGQNWLKQATATLANPQEADHTKHEIVLGIDTTDLQLAPGASQDLTANIFFGPRYRSLLNNAYYSTPGVEYFHTLEIGGSCTYCTFQWLVGVLMTLLSAFHWVLRDWGLSIIALVFLVRAILHPITKRAQVNMSKMTKLGPEMEKLKVKYKDDKEGLNKAMMQFYKNQGAAPVLGCLPMFLQMPIWIALYGGLSSTFELRQAPFLQFAGHHLTWISDLSKPDHLIQFSQTFTFFFLQIDGLNIIPFFVAIAMFLNQKFTPKPVATTPEQAQQQKMMQWMPLMFSLFLYSQPSGLNLYILTSTTTGIIESMIIRKHICEREALQPSGPTFVDGEIVTKELPGPKAPAKKGGFMGWFTSLQEKAEQIRNEAQKKAEQQKRK